MLNVVTPDVDSRILSRRALSVGDISDAAGGRAAGSNTRRSEMEPVSDTSHTHREFTALKEEESGGGERTKAMRRPSKLQTTLFGAPGGRGGVGRQLGGGHRGH